jgi:cell division protein FtsB
LRICPVPRLGSGVADAIPPNAARGRYFRKKTGWRWLAYDVTTTHNPADDGVYGLLRREGAPDDRRIFRYPPQLLNGWKQIAQYINRGVRTVQRWEQLGLPVRRPNERLRSAVIAVPQEIDHWIRSTAVRPLNANDEIAALKKRNAELEAEKAALKNALERYQRGNGEVPPEAWRRRSR